MSSHESPRAFAINSVDWNQHQLTFVSMEEGHEAAKPDIYPHDRYERIGDVMEKADLTVVEYFVPELEQTTYSIPVIGEWTRNSIGKSLNKSYGTLADIGHELDIPMGVADIANKPWYSAFEMLPPMIYAEWISGGRFVRPKLLEDYTLTATNARRMLTAEAIMQEADRNPNGTHIAYVAAPAHVNRVRNYILQPQTQLDRAKLGLYRLMPGLDKALRIYEPEGDGWQLTERHKIVRKPLGAAALSQYEAPDTYYDVRVLPGVTTDR